MVDAREILGQVMRGAMGASTQSRLSHALGPQGLGAAGNPLSDLVKGVGQGGAGGLGGLADAARDMLGGAGRTAQRNPVAVGSLAALAGAILGGKTSVPGGALGGGALALLASLALSSLGGDRQGQASPGQENPAADAPLGLREPQTPGEEQELQDKATLVLQAMINAAKADGSIDQGEIQRITGRLESEGAAPEAREFIGQEMLKPMDMDGLIRKVRTPQAAVEVYAASLLAIELDTPAERDYLRQLAAGLGLAPTAVQRVHETLGVAAPT
jgi:uncharacterized membrane protein YebE (DUF533 family)